MSAATASISVFLQWKVTVHSSHKGYAFVSGGSKGIGLAIVKALAAKDYFVITCGRSRSTWKDCVEANPALSEAVDFQEVDLSRPGSIDLLFDYIRVTYKGIHLAVNNASPALESGGDFESLENSQLLSTLLSDLWVPALCLKHELGLMTLGGAIVNISSVNGIRPTPGAAAYSAAKHGLEGLTRSVAAEAIAKGVRVNAVAPGVTWTPRWETRVNQGKANRKEIEKIILIQRFAKPDEIAAAVLWLLGSEASYVVGHTLVVDGGLSLN
jgi:NAD(P)-dependent dehydrogenase (short-subunit alcohol dehydrogenase family)